MTRRLLFYLLLLLLVVLSALCPPAYSAGDAVKAQPTSTSVELFKTNEEINNIIKPKNEGESEGNGEKITPLAFYSPLLVATDDVMIALTGVNRTDNDGDKHVDILTKYITTKKGDGCSLNTTNGGDWKTQLAFQKDNQKKNVVKGIAAAAKENKIYLLLLNETESGDSNTNCGIQFVEGTVNGKEKETSKMIKWETKESNSLAADELKKCLTEVQLSKYLSASSVYLDGEKEEIVFVVHGTDKENKKNIYAFISVDNTAEGKAKLSYKGMTESSCLSAFFLWGDKIMMIPTNCGENNGKLIVKELSDMGKEWTEGVRPFSYVVGFLQNKNDFTATTINGSNVLLFTQQKSKEEAIKTGGQSKYDFYLWFTDGNRVSTAGRIKTDDNITSSKLLHTKGKLFGLYKNISNSQPENIKLTCMEDQLEKMTTVITAWKKSDEVVKKLFKDTPLGGSSITDALVGFLSNRNNVDSDNGEWMDEYYYVNARVNGGTEVDDGGFTFKEKGAGAKWPVGKPKEDQPYNFIDPGFTLVANVTIDGVVTSDNGNSVLGLSYNKDNQNQNVGGLWCTKGGKWGVNGKEGKRGIETNGKQCQHGNTYLVAVMSSNGKCSLYVDGEKLSAYEKDFTIEKDYENSFYFYFGADESQNGAESHVTVTNVLLYNRPFLESEIEKLKIIKQEKLKERSEKPANHTDSQERRQGDREITGGSSGGNGDGSDTTDKDTKIADMTSSPSQPESSTARGGVSGALLTLLLFGLYGHYLR